MRAVCRRCQAPLPEPGTDLISVCSNCGKRWQLTADGDIATTTLVVHDADHKSVVPKLGEHNG